MRTVFCVAMGILAFSIVGCGATSLAKRGVQEIRGASGELVVLRELDAPAVLSASDIALGRIDNDAGPDCSAEFIAQLREAFRMELGEASAKVAAGTGPSLRVNARVLYYRGGSEVKKLLGSMTMSLARVEVVQSGGTRVVGRANVVGSTKAIRSGPEDLAQEMAKEVASWIKKRVQPAD